jgi:hypothetical protein
VLLHLQLLPLHLWLLRQSHNLQHQLHNQLFAQSQQLLQHLRNLQRNQSQLWQLLELQRLNQFVESARE